MSKRNFVLGFALLASIAWSAWALTNGNGVDVVQANVRFRQVRSNDARSSDLTPAQLRKGSTGQDGASLALRPLAPLQPRNLFAAYSYEAPPPAGGAVHAEPPRAPPLPFAFTGRIIVRDQATYLLLQGDVPVAVTVGSDVGDFKLVEADSQHLVFLHAPTGQRVPLSIASEAIR